MQLEQGCGNFSAQVRTEVEENDVRCNLLRGCMKKTEENLVGIRGKTHFCSRRHCASSLSWLSSKCNVMLVTGGAWIVCTPCLSVHITKMSIVRHFGGGWAVAEDYVARILARYRPAEEEVQLEARDGVQESPSSVLSSTAGEKVLSGPASALLSISHQPFTAERGTSNGGPSPAGNPMPPGELFSDPPTQAGKAPALPRCPS